MSWTGVGAGAAEGLETLLARHRAEEQLQRQQQALAETTRSNQAQEGLRGRALDIDQRQAEAALGMQQQMQQMRQEQNAATQASRATDDARAQLALMPIGTDISPEDYERFVSRGAAVPGMFEQTSVMEGDDASEPRPITKFKGTAQQQHQATTESQRAETEARREREFGERMQRTDRQLNRLESYGPPTVNIFDPNSPTRTSVVPRNQLPPGGAPGPEVPGQRTQITQNAAASEMLEHLNSLFDQGAGKMVGPAEGRLRVLGQKIPGVPVNDLFAEFEAASSAIRNATIKAITGAQLSEPEARRIMSQIPDSADKPEVWKAKYRQSQVNLRNLEKVVGQRGGGGNASPAPTSPRQTIQSGRFTIEVEP